MRILSMSGYVPEEICDTVRFSGYEGERNISHYCGYAADFISQVLHDDSIDGAVFPHSCDSSRIMKNYLNGCGKFIHQLNIPIRRDSAAVTYFAEGLREYKAALESHYNIKIDDMDERTDFLGKRNARLAELYDNLDSVRYSDYLQLVHDMLQKPLFEQLDLLPDLEKAPSGKKVFLIGSYLSNVNIAKSIENCGMTVIADDLPESGRLVSRKPSEYNGSFESIAESILFSRLSPTQNNFREILRTDLDIIKSKGARGIIFVTQKYCEPYDYLYSVYKKMLDENDIPSIKISVTNSRDEKNAGLMLETFADML